MKNVCILTALNINMINFWAKTIALTLGIEYKERAIQMLRGF